MIKLLRRLASVVVLVVLVSLVTAQPARADNWTQIFRDGDRFRPFNIAACKTAVDSIYGPMWRVKILVDRKNSGIPGAEFKIYRNDGNGRFDQVQGGQSFSWWIGTLTIFETYASAWFDDRVYSGSVDWAGNSQLGTALVRTSNIGFC